MFCGIIRHQGVIVYLDLSRGRLRVFSPQLAWRLRPGDSIAVDGVCLTVTRRTRQTFSVDLSPETIRRTTFRWLRPGRTVNLELPMRLSDRIHGHPVLGHVDGVGIVRVTRPVPGILTIRAPARLCRYIAEKGSIAVNGVSLTIASRYGKDATFALIPETLRRTNFRVLKPGARVNLEVDVLARYTLGARTTRK